MPNRSSIFNFDRRDPLLALAIFVVAVIVLETCFSKIPDNRLVKAFRADAMPPKPPKWQVMGDSVAQGGILARELSSSLDDSFVYNAAIPATGPEFSYFVLKREIAAGKAPRAILYAPSPHTFDSKRVAMLVGGYARWDEIWEILKSRIEVCEVIYGGFCKLSYTLRYREQLGQVLKGKNGMDREDNVDVAINAPAATGKAVHHYTIGALHPMYKKPFAVQHFNAYFLEKFLSLAEAHQIPVYWITMPVNHAVYDSRKPFQFSEKYHAFLAGLETHHHVILLQKDFLVYGDEFFKDQTHLNRDGAERFTNLLVKQLLVEEKTAANLTGLATPPQ